MSTAVVIGAGLAGLTAARDLHLAGWTVVVLEASDRLGGKILTSPVGDREVDAGADSFLARVPHATQLVRELGLGDDLVSPAATVPAYIHREGRLISLPPGLAFGVPTDLDALIASRLVSDDAIEAARRDEAAEVDPAGLGADDTSVGSLCRARLGDEITGRLIDPLVAGINAGDIDRLSLRAGAPILDKAARTDVSLIRGIRAIRPATGPSLGSAGAAPVFHGVRGGTARIIAALADALPPGTVRLGTPAAAIARTAKGLRVATPDGAIEADTVVIATEAAPAARLVEPLAPDAAALVGSIETASVAQVTFAFPMAALGRTLDASGALFPVVDSGLMTANTWFSTKWEHYGHPDEVLVRATSGRHHDRRAMELDDTELVARLLAETRAVLQTEAKPSAVRVQRWTDALPQYTVGHTERVDAAMADLADTVPGLHLIGASYRGIGIPAVIAGARSVVGSIGDPAGAPG